ncbi:MAG: hypothetical protein JXQ81_03980 [Desulfuromonadales bacterium]|nr:hypothetical protein [Desulfuromonadales bacterium]
MNTRKKDLPSQEGQQMLETLRQSVSKALEKKRRLGQYAVIWKNGKPMVTSGDAPGPDKTTTNNAGDLVKENAVSLTNGADK